MAQSDHQAEFRRSNRHTEPAHRQRHSASRGIAQGVLKKLALAAALLLAGVSWTVAEAPGYWSCEDWVWVAMGEPEHSAPEWDCGTAATGEPTDTEAKCEAAGGEWRPIGLYPEPVCVTPAADGGRYCQDGGECLAGTCLAEFEGDQWDRASAGETVAVAGYCAAVSPVVGCIGMVEAGVVGAILCID